ncbi:MAG: SCO family protein [Melioribacteraceae bacterium]|nr:SCO family protein [Melioribacteraceae bacterium]MCF8263105.1 SCO family protein [Melioribacteraceae bacterium]MCF8430563.1 SCO family protein [Melioribacteraceae bacterium]
MKIKQTVKYLSLTLIAAAFISCGNELPIEDDIKGLNISLINQDSVSVIFPEKYLGKPLIAGYIFTNCPDICPLTTNNIRLIRDRAEKEGIEDVNYLAISFDPEVDKPNVLKAYAEIRNLDLSNWDLLTGEKTVIDSLMKRLGIFYVPSDTTQMPDGTEKVYFVHTDRISLFDAQGRLRNYYKGSNTNIEQVITDLKTLTN